MTYQPARYADYASAPCVAIVDGKRCGRRWRQAHPCTWGWDPVTGLGVDGPYVVLCGIHRRAYGRMRGGARESGGCPRMRVVGGWLGAYNKHNYGDAVFAAATGWRAAPRWLRHRRDGVLFGAGRTDAL